METNDFISNLQQGFRQKCGTFNHINTLINILQDRKNGIRGNTKDICLTYVDIKKAFDSVETIIIQKTLRHYGIPEDFIKLITNIYTENEASISTTFGETKPIKIQRGVRQGDGLSPLLFIIILNPII